MDSLEYQLMDQAHFNYGATVFAMIGCVRTLREDIERGNTATVAQEVQSIRQHCANLESNYCRIDLAKYDTEHGVEIMREIKEEKLPKLRDEIEGLEKALESPDEESLKAGLQSLRTCVFSLSSLGGKFWRLPKYQQYREERKKLSGMTSDA